MHVVKGKTQQVDRARTAKLLASYRQAKDAESAAKRAADEAREALIMLAGDAEILVDKNGVQLCKIPERSRRSLPINEALEIAPMLEALVNTSYFRVVMR